jgi:hypothetical protein
MMVATDERERKEKALVARGGGRSEGLNVGVLIAEDIKKRGIDPRRRFLADDLSQSQFHGTNTAPATPLGHAPLAL